MAEDLDQPGLVFGEGWRFAILRRDVVSLPFARSANSNGKPPAAVQL